LCFPWVGSLWVFPWFLPHWSPRALSLLYCAIVFLLLCIFFLFSEPVSLENGKVVYIFRIYLCVFILKRCIILFIFSFCCLFNVMKFEKVIFESSYLFCLNWFQMTLTIWGLGRALSEFQSFLIIL
jgi:hypothetical protein